MKVHQLIHGYDKGHTELSSTVRLNDEDADLIARLSDLSGSISSKGKLPDYLTMYPLQSQRFYAVAKTWPDLVVKRPGCVLTQTLLVPMEHWRTMKHPKELARFFQKPERENIANLAKVIEIEDSGSDSFPSELSVNPSMGRQFISKFFEHGTKPIVWVGQENAEDILWRLLLGVWPALRESVSGCSYAIQPMIDSESYFDWMFVPKKYSGNFDEFKKEHFISQSLPVENQAYDFWYDQWFSLLFGSNPQNMAEDDSTIELFNSLDSDPTSIRLLFLLDRQKHMMNKHPTAAAGLLDLIETLSPQSNSSIELKERMCEKALKAIENFEEPNHRLKVLLAIDDKIQHEAFADVGKRVLTKLEDTVLTLTIKSSELFLETLEQMLIGNEHKASEHFINGVIKGFGALSKTSNSQDIAHLAKFPHASVLIVGRIPNVVSTFARVGSLTDMQIEDQLTKWVNAIQTPNELIRCLLPDLKNNWKNLTKAILRKTDIDILPLVLTTLAKNTHNFEENDIAYLISDNLANRLQQETLQWCLQSPKVNPGIAQVIASCYSNENSDLKALLRDTELLSSGKVQVVSQYLIRNYEKSGIPNWLKEELKNSSDLISLMLFNNSSLNDDVQKAAAFLFDQVPNLALPPLSKLGSLMNSFVNCTFFESLRDRVLRAVITAYIRQEISEEIKETYQQQSWAAPWFGTVTADALRKIFADEIATAAENGDRAWNWFASAPEPLFKSHSYRTIELVMDLLSLTRHYCTANTETYLCTILRRIEQNDGGYLFDRVCGQTLQFCFSHTNYPLSKVVVKTFPRTYSRILESRNENIFLEIFDWDKGKELRKTLIRAFMQSDWPPGDLALAANDRKLLRKLVKRILVTQVGGLNYLDRMVIDLRMRGNNELGDLPMFLAELRDNPNFSEDWF